MTKFGSKPTQHNVNTLPKWARLYIITNGIEGKLMSVNSLPKWAIAQIKEIKAYRKHCSESEKLCRQEACHGCKSIKTCTPKNKRECDELREVPPCG